MKPEFRIESVDESKGANPNAKDANPKTNGKNNYNVSINASNTRITITLVRSHKLIQKGPWHSLWFTVTVHGPRFWPLFVLFVKFLGKNLHKMGTNFHRQLS